MRRIFCLLLMVLPLPAVADGWSALEREGAIAIMRHALAPGGGDPAQFVLEDCETQRNLDARGRAQARAIGAEMRARGVTFDRVFTSQWCRCRETAALIGMRPAEDLPSLNSFFGGQGDRVAQTAATLATLAAQDARLLLVTHQVNITALTGVFPKSGEIIVAELHAGALMVTGRILIDPPE
ncbi:histidine phosphatase family protein [Lentibacter sp.]|uniref:histidine phosphatase family protein n=1 Tax=Lentibacter sp. TaxID=2024994 RepID=UPI003F69B312